MEKEMPWGRSHGRFLHTVRLCALCALRALCLEAGGAENRLPTFGFRSGFEGDLAGRTALGADGVMECAVVPVILPLSAAVLAALRGLETTLGIEFLLTVGEGEGSAALAAR